MHEIFELIDRDDADAIASLLARDPGAVGARDDAGVSPVAHALYQGKRAAFDAIRASGPFADPWDRLLTGESDGLPAPGSWSPDGFTPLHLAAFVDNVGAAEALLAEGADPNTLSTASFARVTPLGTCVFAGATGVARVLLERGADPHIGEDGEYSVEAEAIARGNTELVDLIRAASGQGDSRDAAG